MDVAKLVKSRLNQLGHEQRDLAAAIHVTPSFISQLLNRKKKPPSPHRTEIYQKIEQFLKLPKGNLSKLADLQRTHELKRRFEHPIRPLFEEVRELVLSKCSPEKKKEVRQIFEKEPFGEIERIVTQKLLDVAKGIAKKEGENKNWLQLIARRNRKSYQEMRMIVLDFLDTDIFKLTIQNYIYFFKPLIESWDIDLTTFHISVVLSPTLGKKQLKKFAFVEMESDLPRKDEPGLRNFLKNRSLCTDITQEEVEFLRQLNFKEKKPTALYYYRELQNLRDPINFHSNL